MEAEIGPRTFRDERDEEWEVRAITPAFRDRRAPVVRADHANGWLLFTLGLERRRFAPLPPNWNEVDDAELKRWCETAERVQSVLNPPPDSPTDS